MDLQKVFVPTNNNASQNGSRQEADAGKGASSGLPFADMIRMPLIGITDIFASLGNSAEPVDNPSEDYRHDDSDQRRPSDEANARKDAPEHTQRDDNARANDSDNDRVEKVSDRDDSARDDHEPGEKQDNHAAKDGDGDNTSSDDVAKETPKDADTASADNTDDDGSDVTVR